MVSLLYNVRGLRLCKHLRQRLRANQLHLEIPFLG